jgi:hypothetical protein
MASELVSLGVSLWVSGAVLRRRPRGRAAPVEPSVLAAARRVAGERAVRIVRAAAVFVLLEAARPRAVVVLRVAAVPRVVRVVLLGAVRLAVVVRFAAVAVRPRPVVVFAVRVVRPVVFAAARPRVVVDFAAVRPRPVAVVLRVVARVVLRAVAALVARPVVFVARVVLRAVVFVLARVPVRVPVLAPVLAPVFALVRVLDFAAGFAAVLRVPVFAVVERVLVLRVPVLRVPVLRVVVERPRPVVPVERRAPARTASACARGRSVVVSSVMMAKLPVRFAEGRVEPNGSLLERLHRRAGNQAAGRRRGNKKTAAAKAAFRVVQCRGVPAVHRPSFPAACPLPNRYRQEPLLTYARESAVHMLVLLFIASRTHVNKNTSFRDEFDAQSRAQQHCRACKPPYRRTAALDERGGYEALHAPDACVQRASSGGTWRCAAPV